MPDLGRIASPLAAFIEWVTRRIDYHALYPCSVVSQSDQTLELMPDDERMKGFGLTEVPIKTGAPGYAYDVPNDTRVLLGFEAGDPKRPFAALWEAEGDVDCITFDGGDKDIGRVEDSVHAGFMVIDIAKEKVWLAPPTLVGGAVLPGVYAGPFPVTNPNDPSPPDPTTPAIPLSGLITSGNDKLKA